MRAGRPILTFDCYGTLIDWERGIVDAFRAAAAERGAEISAERVLDLYARVEPEVEAGEYRSYRAVLAETARRIAEAVGLELRPGDETFLAESLPRWRPFADTRAALRRLAAGGYGLGILSNVDDALLAESVRGLGVELELTVTAQAVRGYKPGHGHFLAARRALAGRPWTHVAQSLFHDIAPARELGIPVVWINRKGESRPPGLVPDAEFADLAALADNLLAGTPSAGG